MARKPVPEACFICEQAPCQCGRPTRLSVKNPQPSRRAGGRDKSDKPDNRLKSLAGKTEPSDIDATMMWALRNLESLLHRDEKDRHPEIFCTQRDANTAIRLERWRQWQQQG